MVVQADILANMPPEEKSVKNLVTNENLQSAGLLDPHQNVRAAIDSTTEESLFDPSDESVQQASRPPEGVMIREPTDLLPPPRAAPDTRDKG